jgi:uncharacterized protein YjbJ (UPF0337 family)
MRQEQGRGRPTRAKGTMQEALGILSGDRKLEREDLVRRAEGSDQEEFGVEHGYGDEVVTDLGNAINKE